MQVNIQSSPGVLFCVFYCPYYKPPGQFAQIAQFLCWIVCSLVVLDVFVNIEACKLLTEILWSIIRS